MTEKEINVGRMTLGMVGTNCLRLSLFLSSAGGPFNINNRINLSDLINYFSELVS